MSLRTTLFTFAAVGLMGCGPQEAEPILVRDAGPPDVSTPDAGVMPERDAGTPNVHASLLIQVLTSEGPAAGATVALDPPGDFRYEAIADERGLVTFQDIDWDRSERSDITVYKRGCQISTYVGLTMEDYESAAESNELGATELNLHCERTEPQVVFRGTALHMRDPTHSLSMTTSVGGAHQKRGATWALTVPSDTQFTALAVEYYLPPQNLRTVSWRGIEQVFVGWTATSHPGATEDSRFDLDFADALTSTVRASGVAPVPEDGMRTLFSLGRPYVSVWDSTGKLFLGAALRVDIDSTGRRLEFESEHVELDGVVPHTRYFLSTPNRAWSLVTVRGAPSSAQATDVEFIEPPVLVDAPAGRVAFGDEIRWAGREVDLTDPEVSAGLYLFDDGGKNRWAIHSRPGATHVRVPMPPSGVDLEQLSPGGSFAAYLQLAAFRFDDDGVVLQRRGQAPPFTVRFE